jgi:hypothetical protein
MSSSSTSTASGQTDGDVVGRRWDDAIHRHWHSDLLDGRLSRRDDFDLVSVGDRSATDNATISAEKPTVRFVGGIQARPG